jgi:hypothetical protein
MSENSTCLSSGQGVGPVGRPSTMRIGASGLSGKPNRVSMSLKLAAIWGMSAKDAGVFVGGTVLEAPEDGTTVKLRNRQRLVQDGPYADIKVRLGGFFIIDVPEWAAPASTYSRAIRLREDAAMREFLSTQR